VRRFGTAVLALAQVVGCVPDDPPGKQHSGAPVKPMPAVPFRAPSALAPGPLRSAAPAASGAQSRPGDDPALSGPFADHFDRPALGPEWDPTSPSWRLEGGKLCVAQARNHPVWLKKKLPLNARIEFDATSYSEEGDIKAELWGDGRSAADHLSYNDATSYLTVFGGWKNSYHVLARLDEHAPDRPEIRLEEDSNDVRARKVQPNRAYHFKVVRDDGRTVRWSVDDVDILAFTDPSPLSGPGHDHFGFNDWDVRVCFDNLTVTPLP